jgi:uncharacterized protein Veg
VRHLLTIGGNRDIRNTTNRKKVGGWKMGIYRSEIADLRKNIGENIGQKIIIKESPGKRSKPQEKSAIIENVYNSYFRVKFEEADRVGSYNYTDLFTRSVEVSMYNGESYEPLVQPQLEVKKTRVTPQSIIENS